MPDLQAAVTVFVLPAFLLDLVLSRAAESRDYQGKNICFEGGVSVIPAPRSSNGNDGASARTRGDPSGVAFRTSKTAAQQRIYLRHHWSVFSAIAENVEERRHFLAVVAEALNIVVSSN